MEGQPSQWCHRNQVQCDVGRSQENPRAYMGWVCLFPGAPLTHCSQPAGCRKPQSGAPGWDRWLSGALGHQGWGRTTSVLKCLERTALRPQGLEAHGYSPRGNEEGQGVERNPAWPSRLCTIIGFSEKWICPASRADCWFANWRQPAPNHFLNWICELSDSASRFILPFLSLLLSRGSICAGYLDSRAVVKVGCRGSKYSTVSIISNLSVTAIPPLGWLGSRWALNIIRQMDFRFHSS